MTNVNVFVYGTLRPGGYNFSRMSGHEEVRIVKKGCKAFGLMMHNAFGKRPVYPVVTHSPLESDFIIGDLLEVDSDSRWYTSVVRMEVGAGYDVEVRDIKVPRPGGRKPRTVQAEMFIFQYDTDGVHIPSGDWFEFAGAQR